MPEPAETPPPTPRDDRPPARRPLTREEVRAMAERVMDRYPRVMAKLAE
jgi:hypothetical protein